jgi:hypothetical protein
MAESASAAASTGINAPGGAINFSKPDIWPWVVIGLGLVLAAIVLIKRKK